MGGVTWDAEAVDVHGILSSLPERARARFRAQTPELVWNAASLEGNTYTLPEVRTLLDGVTVAGRSVGESRQVLDLTQAYLRLDDMLAAGSYRLDKAHSDELHGILARNEALDPGVFRGEGQVTGGGHVRLANGTMADAVEHGPGGALLVEHYQRILDDLALVEDPRTQALAYFAAVVRAQVYFDGNKRTARLMMAGHLISSGFDVVAVPAARRLEYNRALDELFATDDATVLMQFLSTCTID